MQPWHMLVCAVLIVAAVVLVAIGAGAAAVLPALGCVAMMGMMTWMMIRTGDDGGGKR
jgi:hypothetical protein